MIVIPGRPTSWKRTEDGKRKTRRTETQHRIAAQRIRIVARDTVPPDWSRQGTFALLVVNDFERRSSAADWDNLGKLPSDALQGIVFDDDRQVVDGRSVKRYEQPEARVIVCVWRVRA